MSTLLQSISAIPRGIAAIGLLTISIFKLYAIMNSGVYFSSMLSLCVTGFFALDATNVFLLWVAAFGLAIGARTRVVALFSLCLVAAQTAICLSHMNAALSMGKMDMNLIVVDLILLSVLITALMVCVAKGGGAYAFSSRGWHWAVLD